MIRLPNGRWINPTQVTSIKSTSTNKGGEWYHPTVAIYTTDEGVHRVVDNEVRFSDRESAKKNAREMADRYGREVASYIFNQSALIAELTAAIENQVVWAMDRLGR